MRWQPFLRRVALGLLLPLVVLLLGLALLLGRLAEGPLDVTGLTHRWGGALAHQGNDTLSWGRVALSWQPQHHAHPAELLVAVDDLRFLTGTPMAASAALPATGKAAAAFQPGGLMQGGAPGAGPEAAAALAQGHQAVQPPAGAVVQHLGHLGVIFNLAALLRGKVMLRSLDVQGLALTIIRDGQGRYQLAGLPAPSAHKGGGSGGLSLPMPGLAVQLRHIGLHGIRLTMQDGTHPGEALTAYMPLLLADYHRVTGWRGQLVASLQEVGHAGQEAAGSTGEEAGHAGQESAPAGSPGGGQAGSQQNAMAPAAGEPRSRNVQARNAQAGDAAPPARLTGSIGPAGEGKSHWQLVLSLLRPAMLARWLPLAPEQRQLVQGVDLPLSFQLSGQLGGRGLLGRVEELSGQMEAGAGYVTPPGKAALHLAGAHASLATGPVTAGPAPGGVSSAAVPAGGRGQVVAMQARLLLVDSHGAVVPLSLNSHGTLDALYHPRQVELALEGDAPGFDFATLGSIWPEGAARGARRWMTTNMTAGRGEGLHIATHLRSADGFAGLDVDQLSGVLKGHGLSVTWLAGLPQVTGVEACARFLDADHLQIDVSHGRLAGNGPAGNGRGSIALPAGRITLAGLMKKEQKGQFSLGMEGQLPSFLAILAQPRLNLLSRHPVGFSHAGGRVKGTLSLSLPLDVHVRMQDMTFGAEFEARQVQLLLPSLGPVRQGWGHLSIHDAGLDITGGAQLWGLGVRGTLFDSFQANRPGRLMLRADLTAPLAAADLRRLGAPPSMARAPLLRGQGQAHVIYSQYGQGPGHNRSTALLQTDFTTMAFNASYWQKPAGVPAGLRATLGWDDGRLTHLDDVQAYGPLLALQAEARLRRGLVGGLSLTHLRLGRTEGRATLDWPLKDDGANGRYQFSLQAGTLDMTPWWGGAATSLNRSRADGHDTQAETPLPAPVPRAEGTMREEAHPAGQGAAVVKGPMLGSPASGGSVSGSSGSAGAAPVGKEGANPVSGNPALAAHRPILPAGRWSVSLHADRVIYGDGQNAGNVSATARWAAQALEEASLRIEQPNRVTFSLAPVAGPAAGLAAGQAGMLDVRLDIADAGALFASLGLYRQFTGGVLSLRGRCQPVGAEGVPASEHSMGFGLGLLPFQGVLKVDHMALEHPPAPLVMATVMAPLHWGQLGRERFENVRLRASLHLAGRRLDVKDGRASNDIFGGTLQGRMDFGRARLQMQGTLSPFFGVNHAAGTMFGEKTVMAPEKGSGVMAMTYTLEGSFAKPALHVNPFSALLPGALRNLFD